MRLKKIIFALALLLSLTLAAGCDQPKTTVTPPFFEARDEKTGGVVYMLGSMHAGEKNAEYPEEIIAAFDECEKIACEVDTVSPGSDERLSAAMDVLLCPEGKTAADYFGESYDEVCAFFKDIGISTLGADRYIPAVWGSLLSNKTAQDCGYYAEYGTEAVFISMARKSGKEIIELETAEGQYGLSASEPMALQVYSVTSAAGRDYDEQLDEMRSLYGAWSSFDGDALVSLLEEEDIPEELSEEYEEFYNAMYTSRQEAMAKRIAEWLENGEKVFVLVGALHYYAEPDILTFLADAGYEPSEIKTARDAA